MKLSARLYGISMFLLGPADTGPYGPPVAPPRPRPRDARGRLLSARKLRALRRGLDLTPVAPIGR